MFYIIHFLHFRLLRRVAQCRLYRFSRQDYRQMRQRSTPALILLTIITRRSAVVRYTIRHLNYRLHLLRPRRDCLASIFADRMACGRVSDAIEHAMMHRLTPTQRRYVNIYFPPNAGLSQLLRIERGYLFAGRESCSNASAYRRLMSALRFMEPTPPV